MAKFKDEVELLISARNETRAVLAQAAAENKRLAREQERAQAVAAQRANQLAGLEAEIEQRSLRRKGMILEADIAQVRRTYGAKITAARQANDAELADRLETLQRIKIAEAQAAQESRVQAQTAAAARVQAAQESRVQAQTAAAARVQAAQAAQAARQGATGAGAATGGTGAIIAAANSRITQAFGAVAAIEIGARFGEAIVKGVSAAIRGDAAEIARAFNAVPIAGSAMRFGAAIREALLGEQRELTRINELNAERNAAIDRSIENIRRRKQEIQAEREEAARLAQIAIENEGRARAADAESARRFREQQDAVRAANAELTDLQLRRAGRGDEAELLAIREQFQTRIREAERAFNLELAARLRLVQAEKEEQLLADQEVRQQRERLDQRLNAGRERIEGLREQLTQARQAEQAARIPQNQADANRFLTGVREDTQTIEREMLSQAQQASRYLEQQIKLLEANNREIQELKDELASGPRIVGGVFE